MTIHEVTGIMHQIVILQVRGAPQSHIDFLAFDLVDSALTGLLLDILRSHRRAKFRGFAAWALGQIGDKAALDDLRAALVDSDWFVRSCAQEAIRLLDPPPPKEKKGKRLKKVKPVQLRLFE